MAASFKRGRRLRVMHDTSTGELARAILEYWFASLDDGTALDRETEPFRTCFSRR